MSELRGLPWAGRPGRPYIWRNRTEPGESTMVLWAYCAADAWTQLPNDPEFRGVFERFVQVVSLGAPVTDADLDHVDRDWAERCRQR